MKVRRSREKEEQGVEEHLLQQQLLCLELIMGCLQGGLQAVHPAGPLPPQAALTLHPTQQSMQDPPPGTDRQTDRQMYRKTDTETDIRTDNQTDRHTDRCTERQTMTGCAHSAPHATKHTGPTPNTDRQTDMPADQPSDRLAYACHAHTCRQPEGQAVRHMYSTDSTDGWSSKLGIQADIQDRTDMV